MVRTKKKSAKAKPAAKKRPAKPRAKRMMVLVGTRKGAWIFHGDGGRKNWRTDGPHFLGQIVNHVVLDPRDRKTMLVAASTGHLGPTMFRSTDAGKTWKESKRPPAFAKAPEGEKGRTVKQTFWLTPGHASQANVWYAGTSPQGIFRSEDGGESWEPYTSINDDPKMLGIMGAEQDGTPDGPKLHSLMQDPRDPKHFYFAMSSGGVHESLDGGATWKPLVEGLEVVGGFDPKVLTFHDPHCVRLSANPDRLYQQNHCGIYRLDRPGTKWTRIGNAMPKKVGDVGFPMVVHPRDADTAWVFPMNGEMVWPRTSPDGKPAVYGTKNGGKSWQRMDAGMPSAQAYWTVKRQAMAADARDPVGLYFGTTSGELWLSRDEGKRWNVLARHLPEIYSVETAEL